MLRAYAFESSKVWSQSKRFAFALDIHVNELSLPVLTAVSLQAQEMQLRILELERTVTHSHIASPHQESVHDLELQHEFLPTSASQLSHILLPGTPNEGVGGPWIIGNKRHPELTGRAMRDVAVQVQLSLSQAATSHAQGHVEVQTDVCEMSDRSSSPLPPPPPIRDEDDGKCTL